MFDALYSNLREILTASHIVLTYMLCDDYYCVQGPRKYCTIEVPRIEDFNREFKCTHLIIELSECIIYYTGVDSSQLTTTQLFQIELMTYKC
jgi:hypothetical protein